MTDHPITPPPELFAEWFANSLKTLDRKVSRDDTGTTGLIAGEVAIQAARWGADQELEACGKDIIEIIAGVFADRVIDDWDQFVELLRDGRRPKPPSLKEQALMALEEAAYMADDSPPQGICSDQIDIIRRALEALPE